MDQQVSPAVIVIVMVLVVAIGVGLYFLAVEGRPDAGDDAGGGEMVPPDDAVAVGQVDGDGATTSDQDEGDDTDDASDEGDDAPADETTDTDVPSEG